MLHRAGSAHTVRRLVRRPTGIFIFSTYFLLSSAFLFFSSPASSPVASRLSQKSTRECIVFSRKSLSSFRSEKKKFATGGVNRGSILGSILTRRYHYSRFLLSELSLDERRIKHNTMRGVIGYSYIFRVTSSTSYRTRRYKLSLLRNAEFGIYRDTLSPISGE